MVTDSNDGVAKASLFPYDLTAVGGTLYFDAVDHHDGVQLFESNGTAAGTTMVKDIPGANSYPGSYPHEPDGRGQPALLLGQRAPTRAPSSGRRTGRRPGPC